MEPVSTRQPYLPHAWLRVLAGLLVVPLVVAGVVFFLPSWRFGSATSRPAGESALADPRIAYDGPYSNVRPEVQYVGDAACASCHPRETASFRHHPMGQSIVSIQELAPKETYDQAHHNPFLKDGSRFEVVRSGDRVVHRETRLGPDGQPVYVFDTLVDYAIGSGTHGRSYLSVRDGFVFQTPISWYSQKDFWDLSPGFVRSQFSGRAVSTECLYCHTNRALPIAGTLNRYRTPVFGAGSSIGCERCHGPGGQHVLEPAAARTIVNPTDQENLTPVLRDAICEQCHLEGEVRVLRRGRNSYDFRPGLALDTVFRVFAQATEPGEEHRAVSHVEQMHESRCYLESAGAKKMACITCHDPHNYPEPAQQPAFYREKCLRCHGPTGTTECTEPLSARTKISKDDNCVQCHMPPLSSVDIVHNASSDHRILRRPRASRPQPAAATGKSVPYPLVPFGQAQVDSSDKELLRDLALSLVTEGEHGKRVSSETLSLLDEAIRRAPDDLEILEAKAKFLLMSKQNGPALDTYEKLLALDPNRESALAAAARLSYSPRQPEKALDWIRRAIAINPNAPGYRALVVQILTSKGAWDEVGEHSQAWMRLDPGSVEARQAWIRYLLHVGRMDEARKEFAVIEVLDPNNAGTHRAWFEYHVKEKRE